MRSTTCKYCGKEFQNSKGLGGHTGKCKMNTKRRIKINSFEEREIEQHHSRKLLKIEGDYTINSSYQLHETSEIDDIYYS